MEPVKGYVQNVSPTKSGKNKSRFFNFHLQTNDNTYRRAVCFDVKMHSSVKSLEDSQTPVKLKNLRRSSTPDDDIYVNKRSKLEKASIREVPFNFSKMPEDDNVSLHLTIKDLQEIQSGQLVSIDARFYKSNGPTKSVFINDQPIRCLENCIVVDHTASFQMTIWGDQIDTMDHGQCYAISNLKVKAYQGFKHLSTTPKTLFQPLTIKDCPHLTEEEIEELCLNVQEVDVTKVSMAENFKSWVICQKCSKAVTELINEDIAKCDTCDAVQKTQDCRRGHSVHLNIIVDNEDPSTSLWVVAFEDCIKEMLNVYNNYQRPQVEVTVESPDDDIYKALLSLPPMALLYQKQTKAVKEVHFPQAIVA